MAQSTEQRAAYKVGSYLGGAMRPLDELVDLIAMARTVADRIAPDAANHLEEADAHLAAFRQSLAHGYVQLLEASRG